MWKDHGTKAIGALTTLVGMFGALDPSQLTDLLGKNGQAYLMAAAGLLTVVRGFQNSKVNGATPASEDKPQ